MATKLGVSENTIGNWKTGSSHPSAHNLLALAELLGVSPRFLNGDDQGEPVAVVRTTKRHPEPAAKDDLIDALSVLKDAAPQMRLLADSIPTLLDALSPTGGESSTLRQPKRTRRDSSL